MSKKKGNQTRRTFVRTLATGSALALGAPAVFSTSKTNTLSRPENTKRYAPNDTIRLAVIGAGGMGRADTDTALMVPGVELVAACDCYDGYLDICKSKWGNHLFVTRDYREVLARSDIDAVIVGTPDHWHKQISVDALRAGKAVYVEKPMVHDISEGHEVVKAQQETGGILQVGSQGMSSLGNEKAKQLIEEGAIGELNYAEGFWARNSPVGAWQYAIPEDASTETCDWDQFLGSATNRPWDPLRFFRWRNYRDYGTGVSGDLFVHLFSSLHFIVSSKGPEKIMATGGLRYWNDGREVPDVLLGMFDYPETETHPAFNLSLRVNFVDGTSGTNYLRLVGSEGAMDVKWEEVVLKRNIAEDPMDAFNQAKSGEVNTAPARKRMLPPGESIYRVESGYKGAHYDHFTNFFNGVRTGKTVTEDAFFGFRAAAPALLCNNSYFDEQIVRWDPNEMKVLGFR